MSSLLDSRWRTAVLVAACLALVVAFTARPRASASGVVISQVYGGGGNSGATLKNDFIELFNAGPSAVDVTGWSVQYASSAGTSWTNRTTLSGVIQPGHYYLIQEAAGAGGTVSLPTPDVPGGSINLSGSSGKVALVSNSTVLTGSCPTGPQIVDFVGFGSSANCYEGSGPTPTLSNTTAALRGLGGVTDANNNATDFTVGPPNPRNSSCTLSDGCPLPTNPTITVTPVTVAEFDPVLLTVRVTPGANPPSTGIVVTGDLSAIGLSATQVFADAGGGIYSYNAGALAQAATFQLPIGAVDAQGRTAAATLRLTVAPTLPIHDIQGPGTVSPYAGQLVATTGIVTGVKYNGFFIEARDAEADADPSTSEGVFVFTNTNPGPPAAAVVGNEVKVLATVSEYKNTSTDPGGLSMTELTSPTTTVLSAGNALPTAVTLTNADLNPGASIFALEKYEGMRVHIDSVVSTSATDGSVDEPSATSTSSGVFYAVLPGTARPFREAGIQTPLPVPPDAGAGANPPVFDANPERIGIDTFSVFLDPDTAKVYPPPPGTTLEVTTGVTVNNITGPLDYAYRSYLIDTEGWNMPSTAAPNRRVQAVRASKSDEFTVATMNLARFYDTTDDPDKSDAVLTSDAFNLRLAKASQAIRGVMLTPDIIGVEEMENLPTLEALAARVDADAQAAGESVPHYAAYLMEGNDIGGIDVGFLVRSDKVEVSGVEQYGKDSTYVEPGGKTAILNDRPALILHAAIKNAPYEPYPVTVIVNHLKALSGIDGSDGARVRAKRLAQAVELAGKLQALQAAGEHVISVGDYNAFDVNDGYVDVMGLLKGTEASQSEVALWAASPVTPSLADLIDLAPPDQRYSYVQDGNAQELDHILSANVTANAVAYARMNADFPESLRGDASTPARLSDHDPIVGYFVLPDIDTKPPAINSVTPSVPVLWAPNHAMVPITIAVSATDASDPAPVCRITGVSGNDGATAADWQISDALTVSLRAERSGQAKAGRTYTIAVACTDASGNVSLPASTTVFVPHDQGK